MSSNLKEQRPQHQVPPRLKQLETRKRKEAPMALNLSTANKAQGFDVIPPGELLALAMKLRAGTVGVEGLCKRSSKGDSEGIDIEYTVKGGEYDGRKLFAFQILDGETAGHA